MNTGTGGIKSNVSPLIAEQMTETRMNIRILPSGERVIQDPSVTYQRIYLIFYWCINIGALSLTFTVFMEKYYGFWSVNLLGLCAFLVGFAVLILGKRHYVTRPPQGSVLPAAAKALWIAMISGRDLDKARPAYQACTSSSSFPSSSTSVDSCPSSSFIPSPTPFLPSQLTSITALPPSLRHKTPYPPAFIPELRRALTACKVFAFYPIFWVIYNQLSTNFVAQAAQMTRHGIPNDVFQNIDPLTIILVIPVLDRVIYPALRRAGYKMLPITRITCGFVCAGLSMGVAAGVQHGIYISPPNYNMPTITPPPSSSDYASSASRENSITGNEISVFYQSPGYLLIALSEIFASVTGLEYAFLQAPASMKSFIMSVFLFTSAGGSVLGVGVSRWARDPGFVWFYLGLGVLDVGATVVFWRLFKHLNGEEGGMNEGVEGERMVGRRVRERRKEKDGE